MQTITPADPELWGFAGYDISDGEYRHDKRYLEIKKIVLDGMLLRLEQAVPGSTSRVKLAELGSPATQTRFVGNTAGAPFGLKQRIDQVGPLRPGARTPIAGLSFAGTNTAWGPGTVGSMLSGVHCASEVTGRDLVAEIRSGACIADPGLLPDRSKDFDALLATRTLPDSAV